MSKRSMLLSLLIVVSFITATEKRHTDKLKIYKTVKDCYEAEKKGKGEMFWASILGMCEDALGYVDCDNYYC